MVRMVSERSGESLNKMLNLNQRSKVALTPNISPLLSALVPECTLLKIMSLSQ